MTKYHQGKPFKLPPAKQAQVNRHYREKDLVVNRAMGAITSVMLKAISEVVDHYQKTGHYAEPALNGLSIAVENFYREVVTAAFHSTQEEKKSQPRVKMAAAKGPPPSPPSGMDKLREIFANSKYWNATKKRAKQTEERMRKQYSRLLKYRFNQMIPLMQSGEVTPNEIKAQLSEAYKTSHARVETMFRTETTNYFARSQIAFFKDEPNIIGFLFDSVRDSGRTDICRSRHGLVYRDTTEKQSALLRENTPALHYNCRSHLIALANTTGNRKLLEDKQRDPERVRVEPLDPKWRK